MGNFHLPGPVPTRMQIFTPKFMVVAHNFPVNLGSETTPSYSMLPTLVVPSFIGLLCQVCPPLLANLPPSSPPTLPSHSQHSAGDAEFRDVGNGALPCGESGPRGQSRAALPSHRARAESTGCLEGWELGMKKMSKSPSEGNRKLHVFKNPFDILIQTSTVWKSQTKGGFELLQ